MKMKVFCGGGLAIHVFTFRRNNTMKDIHLISLKYKIYSIQKDKKTCKNYSEINIEIKKVRQK